VIVADWSTASGGSYTAAKDNVQAIGQSVAQFIDWMSLDKGYLHIIGFDLGGS
jgi:Lipase